MTEAKREDPAELIAKLREIHLIGRIEDCAHSTRVCEEAADLIEHLCDVLRTDPHFIELRVSHANRHLKMRVAAHSFEHFQSRTADDVVQEMVRKVLGVTP